MRIRSRALGPLAVVFLAIGLSTALSFPFMSLFLTSAVHAGPIELTVFLLAQPLAGIVVSTILGRLSDGRVARRRLLMLCAVSGCVGASLYAVLRSYWPLLLLACTVAAVGGAVLPQGYAFARATVAGQPNAPMITSTLRTFFSLSWVAGPPLAALLLTAGGFTTLYACSSGLFAVIAIVVARWFVEPPVATHSGQHGSHGLGLPTARARRSLWTTLVGLVLLMSAMSLNVQALPLLVRHSLHANVGSAGVILGICAAIEIPAMLGFGALSTRMPLQLLVRIGPLFGVAYYALAAAAGQVWELGVCTGAERVFHCARPGPGHQLRARTVAVPTRTRLNVVQQHLPLRHHPGQPAPGYRCAIRLPLQLRRGGRTQCGWPDLAHTRSPDAPRCRRTGRHHRRTRLRRLRSGTSGAMRLGRECGTRG